jgi:hypothetical protein
MPLPAAWYALGNSKTTVGYGYYNVSRRLLSVAPYQLDQCVNFLRCGEGNLSVDQ